LSSSLATTVVLRYLTSCFRVGVVARLATTLLQYYSSITILSTTMYYKYVFVVLQYVGSFLRGVWQKKRTNWEWNRMIRLFAGGKTSVSSGSHNGKKLYLQWGWRRRSYRTTKISWNIVHLVPFLVYEMLSFIYIRHWPRFQCHHHRFASFL
jgi:hypothetical protein